MRATQCIARLIAETKYSKLPDAVADHAKICILDWLGTVFIGVAEPASQAIVKMVRDLGGKEESTVIGDSFRTSCVNAALANGVTGHVAELDDIHEVSVIHPGAPVIPAAIAVAERIGASGEELITAVAMGYETGIRVALAVMPSHYEYWHPTGTCGTFGAATAAGSLLNLDEDAMRNALGIAGTGASGLINSFGTMGKPFNAGQAAMGGVIAALLAEEGFTGPTSIFDAANGYTSATSEKPDLEHIVDALGYRYEALNTIFKRHACCGHTHGAIDAVLDIMKENDLDHRDIVEINVETYPIAVKVVGHDYSPKTSTEAKFSLPYCLAVAATLGSANLDAFTVKQIANPAIRELMGRVKVRIGEEFKDARLGRAEVTIRMKDDMLLNRRVDIPKGYPENPLSTIELKEKFRRLSRKAISEGSTRKLERTIDALENITDVKKLTALLVE
jgi:2-methylcitrate dehydratase PrpD